MAKFRTRARAVDMLGRQQIAGIPTAISEIFKNAHDAYADNVRADLVRKENLLVIRDDGVGMSAEDFNGRWLTVGTESKLAVKGGVEAPEPPVDHQERISLGEKGIGRLSIASIAPQVLVLTRAASHDGTDELVACFVNWEMFQLPGIDLEDIEIPIALFPAGELIGRADVLKLIGVVRDNLKELAPKTDAELAGKIEAHLSHNFPDPRQFDQHYPGPSLLDEGHGTQFFVWPTDDSLVGDIDGSDGTALPSLLKVLMGFANTMTPGHPPTVMTTEFADHKSEDVTNLLISEGEFFTPNDFDAADHQIHGTFDDFGQFVGDVNVFGEMHPDHVVAWTRPGGRPSRCGSFGLHLAVVQGRARQSSMPIEEHGRLVNKLERLGGLYIYKNNVRILPYGNVDFDWLHIEERRTRSASYYYFSHRRMFGVVEISPDQNPDLQEKAGREGFIDNGAYRDFRAILENFFQQITGDFFRGEDARYPAFEQRRVEIAKLDAARRLRDRRSRERRRQFADDLDRVMHKIDEAAPEADVQKILDILERESRAAVLTDDVYSASEQLVAVEATASASLEQVRGNYEIVRPRGVALSRDLRRDWDAYGIERVRLEDTVFSPTVERIAAAVNVAATSADVEIDRRRRFDRAVRDAAERYRRKTASSIARTRSIRNATNDGVAQMTRDLLARTDTALNEMFADASRVVLIENTDENLTTVLHGLDARMRRITDAADEILGDVAAQYESIDYSRDIGSDSIITSTDISVATEEDLLALRERADSDLELTQLGMAIDVINHEFEATIKAVRQHLARLKKWADINPGLDTVYNDISRSFEHLDGYLTLFTPLHRRLHRTRIDIPGKAIHRFLTDLFRERLQRHDITLGVTPEFRDATLFGYPSTFYPVFVNLVDNAMFWLRDQPRPRSILMDHQGGAMFVSDSGPGIPERDREVIFEMGFTRKPGGRGLGLYISKDVLRREGYRLDVIDSSDLEGACFRIERIEEPEG